MNQIQTTSILRVNDHSEIMKHLIPKNDFVGRERDLEDHILQNIEDIANCCDWGEIRDIKRQYHIPFYNGRLIIDIMIWHTDGSGTAIEIKRSKTNRHDLLTGVAQCLFYGQLIESTLSHMPRLVLASPIINIESYNVIKRFDLPIKLLMVDDNRCIFLN